MEITEHPIVFYLLGIPVRDTVVYTWLVMVIIILGVILIEKIKPNLLATLLDAIIGVISSVLDEENLNPYIPFLGSFMVFIFFSSAASIIPGVKSPTSDIKYNHCISSHRVSCGALLRNQKEGLPGLSQGICNHQSSYSHLKLSANLAAQSH
jgi:F0F1-type ATP synthase membrane subunit a